MMTKKRKIIVGLIVGLFLGCGGIGGVLWYLLREPVDGVIETKGVKKKEVKKKEPLFYKTLQDITVNIRDAEDRMISVGFDLGVKDEKSINVLTQFGPKIQSKLILMIKSMSYEKLKDPTQQEIICNDIKKELNGELPEPVIEEILINRYMIN